MENVKDKVVIITGASSGIGEASAKLLAEKGAKIMLAARRENRLKQLQDSIRQLGGEASYAVSDVSNQNDMKRVVQKTLDLYGRVDILVNNAGIMPNSYLREAKMDDWSQTIDVNVKGVLYGIGTVLPLMRQQGHGQIITVGSVAGHVVNPGSVVYASTKFAVRAIMDGVRKEEADTALRFTTISPGLVDTEIVEGVQNEELKKSWDNQGKSNKLLSSDVAEAIFYTLTQPEHVDVSEVIVRPNTKTQQN